MGFFAAWLAGYSSPRRYLRLLEAAPAPWWGLCATLLRGALDSLLLYLPLALMGREPSTPSALSFVPTSGYYAFSVFFMPVYFLLLWLLLSALVHLILRLSGREGAIDQVLNVTGMAGLVVGAFLVPWDWIWVALGAGGPAALGISHLVASLWAVALTTPAFRRLLGLPVWLALLLNGVWMAAGVPVSMVFARAPL